MSFLCYPVDNTVLPGVESYFWDRSYFFNFPCNAIINRIAFLQKWFKPIQSYFSFDGKTIIKKKAWFYGKIDLSLLI